MTDQTPVAKMTPVEVDTILFPILENIGCTEARLDNYRFMLGEVGRQPRGFSHRNVREDGLEYHDPGFQRSSFEETKAKLEAELATLNEQARPYEDEFLRRRWNRYILVAGKRGHLHRESCSTITPGRTLVGLVPEASGLSAKEVAAKFSYTACTHCFPDAPVERKLTPQQEGYCEHSGEYVEAKLIEEGKLKADWYAYAVKPQIRCECGWSGAITAGGKLKKHKPGGAK